MKRADYRLLFLLLVTGCGRSPEQAWDKVVEGQAGVSATLTEARRGFHTKVVRRLSAREPVAAPPPNVFRTVHYDSPAGKLAAYLTPDPRDGRKHPAIIWITGGDCNSIGDVWSAQPANNDQTAAAFRKAGIVMMFPSLRGGNDNPGVKEGFFGEVDDVLAAADYLSRQDFVDPGRMYLGGHSTGGTLVLLTAECSGRFRAVFSFGPVADVSVYPREYLPFDTTNRKEFELRAPEKWLRAVRTPVFVLEGTRQPGNLRLLQTMSKASANPLVHFLPVGGADHFSVLGPVNRVLAAKVLGDTGATSNIALSQGELDRLFGR